MKPGMAGVPITGKEMASCLDNHRPIPGLLIKEGPAEGRRACMMRGAAIRYSQRESLITKVVSIISMPLSSSTPPLVLIYRN